MGVGKWVWANGCGQMGVGKWACTDLASLFWDWIWPKHLNLGQLR